MWNVQEYHFEDWNSDIHLQVSEEPLTVKVDHLKACLNCLCIHSTQQWWTHQACCSVLKFYQVCFINYVAGAAVQQGRRCYKGDIFWSSINPTRCFEDKFSLERSCSNLYPGVSHFFLNVKPQLFYLAKNLIKKIYLLILFTFLPSPNALPFDILGDNIVRSSTMMVHSA